MNATSLAGTHVSGAYDPAIESDGLTIDTPTGPIDLVAVRLAMTGGPVPLTPAERHYVLARSRSAAKQRAAAAAGFGLVERRTVAA